MECEVVQAHLPDYLGHALTPPVAADVNAHLSTCAACAAEYGAIEETWQRLRGIPAAEPDTASMRSRFEAGLQEYLPEHTPRRATHRRFVYFGLQFAAAAALVVLGVMIGRQTTTSSAPDPQLAALRDELRDMREMVAVSLLQQRSATERLKGVSWSNRIDEPGMTLTSALLEALMHDPNVNVRLSTIDALKRFAERDDVRLGALEALSRQTSPIVQVALIDFVVETNGREAAAALRRIANDPMANETVRMRARQGLQQLGIAV
jgi:hypothetical protein